LEPPIPHAGPVGGDVQTLPVQQPPAHDVAVHTQTPPEQACPAAQGAPAPHRQAPAGEQLSAEAPQATHALPSVPQLVSCDVSHVAPLQHPLGHEAELHTQWPLTHA
jgi:hypothetical protein